ncbi:hypothetical protein ACUH9O_03480 [Dermabacteraceae bacterium P13103]
MRSISGTKNRFVLALAGVLSLAAAAWLGVAAFGYTKQLPDFDRYLAHGETTPAMLLEMHAQWLPAAAGAVCLVAVLFGLYLVIGQAPKKPRTSTLRISDADGALLGTIQPDVLGLALAEHVEEQVSGIVGASVEVSGTAKQPWLQAQLDVAEDAETGWSVDAARRMLADDVRQTLGVEPRQIDALVTLRSSRARGNNSEAVLGGSEPRVSSPA